MTSVSQMISRLIQFNNNFTIIQTKTFSCTYWFWNSMFPFKSQLPIAGTALKLGLGFVIFQFKAFILYTKFLSVVAEGEICILPSCDNWNGRFNEIMISPLQNVALKYLTSLYFCWFLCVTLSLTKNTHQHQAFRHFLCEWIIFFLFLILSMWFRHS